MEKLSLAVSQELKEAGFPQRGKGETIDGVYIPTEADLDLAFPNEGPQDKFISKNDGDTHSFSFRGHTTEAPTLIEAKARLWIRINS